MNKIAYFVTEDWTFVEHRLDLAKRMVQEGWDVLLLTRVSRYRDVIEKEGIRVIPIPLSRKRLNPLKEFFLLLFLIRVFNREKPDLLHAVGLKPNVYGAVIVRLCRIKGAIFSVAGFGTAFSSNRFLKSCATRIYRFSFSVENSAVIVQNKEDFRLLSADLIARRGQGVLIRGSGVDTTRFQPAPERSGVPTLLFASRMLRDKGLLELLEASCQLIRWNIAHRLILVGRCDPDNPTSLTEEEIKIWTRQPHIEWWGYRDDMDDIFRGCHIVALPSYHEGLPKVLLEAMASGRAVVATDIPGIREVVDHEHNGLLVPVRDVHALASALQMLLISPELRARLGRAGREIVEKGFGVEFLADEHLKLYRRLLAVGESEIRIEELREHDTRLR
ncbi:MAG: glycosyltransferase family 4 protein [Candidatus Manganitrophus sp.]|nr:glycosyltransferase family 4 protein [Candidatus Manganitrophus sp.]MDC4226502.1 glycosyltransferase family 4 protein [Candidatus Manganitrophus sp.]WDT72309.1 MAG: glycosyltransferase family 4 protein [Candidatus Manganitrophus sp.]WDT75449.1 MAG: glycosyltransferase family 4 protein [Candidatus Manganitrophus sp.]WDT80256.1 MAG: glycosyltransferase family 4 protein [Candidatus Manganitrophus sp.]